MWQAQGKALEVGMDRHGPRSCLVQGFSASAWLTFYAGSFLVVGDCPVHCRTFSLASTH